jgi:outer membrane protein assembly factor BamB
MNLRLVAFVVGAVLAAARAVAATGLTVELITQTVNDTPGFCLHIGAGDGSFSAALAKSGKAVIHGLERDRAKVSAARERLAKQGLYGQVAIETFGGKALPYSDNLANTIVCQDETISNDELFRVLAPKGIAFVQQKGAWKQFRKDWPKDFDEWTHSRHGADGNMVSDDNAVAAPTSVRWIAGPAQDAGGRRWYYDHVLVTAKGRNYYLFDHEIVARDAFNGSFLWSRPVKPDTFREVGTDVPEFLRPKVKLGARPSKVRPVAIGDAIYLAAEGKLSALSSTNGNTVTEFASVNSPREILVSSNTLVVSDGDGVRGFDVVSKKQLWHAPMASERIVAGDGKLFCLAGKTVAAIDINTGSELWRNENPEIDPATTATYHGGTLVLEISSWRDDAAGCGVVVYGGEDGKFLWKKQYRPDMTHYKEARAFFSRDLVWLQSGTNNIIGYDPRSGEAKQTWKSRGKHCATPVATGRYFIAPECDFTDLESGETARARMFKSACRLPFIPANGLLYTFPVQCECFPMLRGYMGMTSTAMPVGGDVDGFERGGAAPAAPSKAVADEWPMYRRDAFRSGTTPTMLRTATPREKWSIKLTKGSQALAANDWADNPFTPGEMTPLVAADGKVFAALPDAHRVVAVDAKSGKLAWSFTAGGRVDLPPTIDGGLAFFGAHDGWVYCLSTKDGSLVWRRRAAPHESRIAAYGQMESAWPAPGSVLIDNGVGYIAAGRHPMCEGGVQVIAFKPRSGELVWQKNINDISPTITNWYGPTIAPKFKVGLDFEPMDMLVKDGDQIAMSRWRFNPANGDFKVALGSTNYAARGQSIQRGAWGYGIRQTKHVLPKVPLAFDDTQVYRGGTNSTALIVAANTIVKASGTEVTVGENKLTAPAPVIHDGLIVAYGRLYAATASGELVCFE